MPDYKRLNINLESDRKLLNALFTELSTFKTVRPTRKDPLNQIPLKESSLKLFNILNRVYTLPTSMNAEQREATLIKYNKSKIEQINQLVPKDWPKPKILPNGNFIFEGLQKGDKFSTLLEKYEKLKQTREQAEQPEAKRDEAENIEPIDPFAMVGLLQGGRKAPEEKPIGFIDDIDDLDTTKQQKQAATATPLQDRYKVITQTSEDSLSIEQRAGSLNLEARLSAMSIKDKQAYLDAITKNIKKQLSRQPTSENKEKSLKIINNINTFVDSSPRSTESEQKAYSNGLDTIIKDLADLEWGYKEAAPSKAATPHKGKPDFNKPVISAKGYHISDQNGEKLYYRKIYADDTQARKQGNISGKRRTALFENGLKDRGITLHEELNNRTNGKIDYSALCDYVMSLEQNGEVYNSLGSNTRKTIYIFNSIQDRADSLEMKKVLSDEEQIEYKTKAAQLEPRAIRYNILKALDDDKKAGWDIEPLIDKMRAKQEYKKDLDEGPKSILKDPERPTRKPK